MTLVNKRVLLAPVLLVAAVACSSSSGFTQPKASSFATGGCRTVAPSVLQIGKDLDGLGKKDPSDAQRTALAKNQKSVRDLQTGLDTTLAPMVQDLVTAVGVVRINIDTNSYDVALRDKALKAYDAVVKACTTEGSG